MRQLEFMGKMVDLLAEWKSEYKVHQVRDNDPEMWPGMRDQDDWLSDFFVWLQCKGYTL